MSGCLSPSCVYHFTPTRPAARCKEKAQRCKPKKSVEPATPQAAPPLLRDPLLQRFLSSTTAAVPSGPVCSLLKCAGELSENDERWWRLRQEDARGGRRRWGIRSPPPSSSLGVHSPASHGARAGERGRPWEERRDWGREEGAWIGEPGGESDLPFHQPQKDGDQTSGRGCPESAWKKKGTTIPLHPFASTLLRPGSALSGLTCGWGGERGAEEERRDWGGRERRPDAAASRRHYGRRLEQRSRVSPPACGEEKERDRTIGRLCLSPSGPAHSWSQASWKLLEAKRVGKVFTSSNG
jgi:hypothetical protein